MVTHHDVRRLVFKTALSLMVFAALSFAQACSFTQHWDEQGLACDSSVVDGRTNFCAAGYTCFNPTVTCIRDATRNLGQACTDRRQCQVDQMCPIDNQAGTGIAQVGDVQTCLRKCQSASPDGGYYQVDGCDINHYCSPFMDGPESLSTSHVIGGCVLSDQCESGAPCMIDGRAGGVCVAVSPSATACVSSCSITFDSTLAYKDNCGGGQYCQPLGIIGAQQFACLDNTRNTQAQNANCSLIEAPCKSGDVCAPTGTCAPYCELTSNPIAGFCGTNMKCCAFANAAKEQPADNAVAGYCAASCN